MYVPFVLKMAKLPEDSEPMYEGASEIETGAADDVQTESVHALAICEAIKLSPPGNVVGVCRTN